MRLKERPADFRVTEIVDAPLRPGGRHALYRVEKERRNTLEVVGEIARLAGVEKRLVSHGGLKDYDARAVQFVSVPGGPERDFVLRDARAVFVGRLDEPLGPGHFRGNRFDVRLRRLEPGQARALHGAAPLLARGVPNYFDDQRFGSVRGRARFPYRALLDGRPEEALRLLLATPDPADTPARRRRAGRIEARWGRWGVCRSEAVHRREKAAFGHLCGRPGDFEGALARLDRPFLLLVAYSYQSHLWNEVLRLRIEGLAGRRAVRRPGRAGPLCFPTAEGLDALSPLAGATLPLPGARGPARWDVPELGEVLRREGLRVRDLGRPTVKGVHLRWQERAALAVPADLAAEEPSADPLHRGHQCLELGFTLTRGSYATTVLKALEALAGAGGARAAH